RLPVALGHRLVLVLGRLRAGQPRGAALVAAFPETLRRLPQAGSAGSAHRLQSAPQPLPRPPAAGAGHPDVEVGVERGAEFLDFFHTEIGMSPIWMCPLRLRETAAPAHGRSHVWPLYPLERERLYVNFGFWGMVPMRPGQRR